MKKSLVALAAMAVCGVASAQSSVTLFGLVDAWVGQTSTTNAAGVKLSQTGMTNGGYNGSRWGLRGTEDLGGMKAKFHLESGFNPDDGTAANGGPLFTRQAFVGVEGGAGSLTIGRHYTPYHSLNGAANHAYDSDFAVTDEVNGIGLAEYSLRVSNSVRYDSPKFGGLSGALSHAFGEDKTATTSASSNTSVSLSYGAGPVMVGVAHQQQKTPAVTTKYNLVAGYYNFGVAQLNAAYNTAKAGATEDKGYQVGLSAPVGAAANVAVGYASANSETAGVKLERTGWVVTGYYSLSKRTTAYAAANSYKNKQDSAKVSKVALGVRHTF